MARIMLVDDQPATRDRLRAILTQEAHQVVDASDGAAALEEVSRESFELILMNASMREMDGFEVLRRLRANPATQDVQVVLLIPSDLASYEKLAMDLGVDHCIPWPSDSIAVKLTVRVAIRDAVVVMSPIRIGDRMLDSKLGGGIPVSSLTLVEGTSSAGKSVLCQHFMFSALRDGHRVVSFTSENSVESLISQMASIGLDVSSDVLKNRFCISQIAKPSPGEDGGRLLTGLTEEIARTPMTHRVICVDAITNLASASDDHAIVGFFSACKRLCDGGRTIILVAHSSAFDEGMLVRLRSLCDAHLSLRVGSTGSKQALVLEARKIQNCEGVNTDSLYFTVEPNQGMRLLPFAKARA